MSLGPLYVLLGEVSVQVLCPFFNWVVCLLTVELCEFFIYFGDPTLVWGIFGKYVFPYCCSLFILMLFSLAMQKLFILIRSRLFILSFVFLALWDISVKILLHGISEIFLPMFSLVGMQTGATTMENNMEFPQKGKNWTAFWASSSTAGIISQESWNTKSKKKNSPQCSLQHNLQ